MDIEWHPVKAAANLAKHGVAFAEAEAVLTDPAGLTMADTDAQDEARYLTLGCGALGRLLVVVWTERGHNYRLISARPATPRERRQYHEG